MQTLEQNEALAPLNDTGVEVKGYQILIEVPDQEEKRGSIFVPVTALQNEKAAACVARVIDMGNEAYLDETRFPKGARCKVGDFIMMSSYSGVRFNIRNEENRRVRDLRLIEDTAVLAVVPSASHVERG